MRCVTAKATSVAIPTAANVKAIAANADTTMLLNRHGANARPTTSSIVEIPSTLASGSSAATALRSAGTAARGSPDRRTMKCWT